MTVAGAPEALFGPLFDDLFEGIQVLGFDYRYIYVNKAAARHGRRDREELIGRRMTDLFPGVEETEMFRLLQSTMLGRVSRQMVNRFTYPDGQSAWFDLRIDPVPLGALVLSFDVSAQKGVEEQLRWSREDLATTLDCMADGVVTTDVGGRVTRMNPAAEGLTGWAEKEALGRPLDDLVGFLDRRTGFSVDHIVDRVLVEGLKIGLAGDILLVARNGREIPIASSGAPIRDANGSMRGVVLLLRDMRAEQELTAMLQRAQRMESLGRLAGGVAHDFNNLLTVICGHCDTLLGRLPPNAPTRRSIQEIRKAGDRAASLTRQLLAFSRQQVLEPKLVDLNAIVVETEAMLRRLIGEDILLSTALEPRLGRVRADPGQIVQVLLNLAINARDAMPQGGRLTIQTADVELDEPYVQAHFEVQAGRYSMLLLSDTGCGMDEATRARIFEPFFTTKEAGKGTGLGLATVFGIVRQSGGHVWVYSEPGHGTTFKVYLPRVEATLAAAKLSDERPATGTEAVLVVEDDEAVREITVGSLRLLGYTVLEGKSGREAIDICNTHAGPIDVLISDVIMPEVGGRQVAEAVQALRPETRVLYLSGFTDDSVVRHGILHEEAAFLQKPFTQNSLARKVREVLGP